MQGPGHASQGEGRERKALEAKRAEKALKLESDFNARAACWLQGINKDLGKLGDCLGSVAKALDKEVKATWKNKLDKRQKDISEFRKTFDKAVAKGKIVGKTEMLAAEAMVTDVRRDIKAWSKIKDLYLPEESD